MSQALYRKYRSKSLAEIVGQEHITDVLAKALAQQRIGHAFLFTGPRGVGKTSIARILAHEINALPYTDEAIHLDIIEIDAASNRRIDDIRDLREKVHIAPTSAQYKVYIIDEVHMLTGESFNALLKTLEEPPAHVIFILATTEVQKLPATIVSRTQRFHFRPVPEAKVIAHLQYIAKTENINIDDSALRLVAQHGEGSFRDSISLLDQLASLSGKDAISTSLVEATLGLAPLEQVAALANATISHNPKEVIAQLQKLETAGVSPAILVTQLMAELRQYPEHFLLIDGLLEVPKSYNPQMKLLTTLVAYAQKGSTTPQPSKNVATPVEAPIASISMPVSKPAPQVKPKQQATETAANEKQEKPAKAPVSSPAVANGPAPKTVDWQEIVEFVRKKSVPLYSVLKHGKAEYENGTLTLYFGYDLHRKKLDNAKYSSEFAAYLQEMYQANLTVTTVIGAPAPKDETAASVAAIMGGGEEVNV